MIELRFLDKNYPEAEITHVRVVSRAIPINEEGKLLFERIARDDQFGCESYYETVGGGIEEGETLEETAVRECGEEIGKRIVLIEKIGVIHDYYNLIHRENESHYYLAKVVGEREKHWVSRADNMIQEVVAMSIDEAIASYEAMSTSNVSGLVRQRELPILYEVKKILGRIA